MLIGILQTGHLPDEMREAHGDYHRLYSDMLAGHGFDFRSFSLVDGEFPDGPDACDGWLISGSKHGAYEDHPWIPPLEALIRAIRDSGRPLIGICFGHQIIAQALGGRVEKFPGGWCVGRTDYVIEGRAYSLNAWHQDQIVDLPPDAEVLGTSPHCGYAALAYGDRVFTVQPHPEFDAGFVADLARFRGRGIVPDAQIDRVEAQLDAPLDNQAMADRIASVLSRAPVRA